MPQHDNLAVSTFVKPLQTTCTYRVTLNFRAKPNKLDNTLNPLRHNKLRPLLPGSTLLAPELLYLVLPPRCTRGADHRAARANSIHKSLTSE